MNIENLTEYIVNSTEGQLLVDHLRVNKDNEEAIKEWKKEMKRLYNADMDDTKIEKTKDEIIERVTKNIKITSIKLDPADLVQYATLSAEIGMEDVQDMKAFFRDEKFASLFVEKFEKAANRCGDNA